MTNLDMTEAIRMLAQEKGMSEDDKKRAAEAESTRQQDAIEQPAPPELRAQLAGL